MALQQQTGSCLRQGKGAPSAGMDRRLLAGVSSSVFTEGLSATGEPDRDKRQNAPLPDSPDCKRTAQPGLSGLSLWVRLIKFSLLAGLGLLPLLIIH